MWERMEQRKVSFVNYTTATEWINEGNHAFLTSVILPTRRSRADGEALSSVFPPPPPLPLDTATANARETE